MTKSLAIALTASLLLAACGGGKVTPDEFEVMDRAPLYVPPISDLRPPRPGEPRAQEIDPGRMAFEALFPGKKFRPQKPLSSLEQRVLSQVGGSEPDIRTNAGDDQVEVVKKVLLLADILAAEDRVFQPDNIIIRRESTDSIRPEDRRDTSGS